MESTNTPAYIAAGAIVTGDVTLGTDASVWHYAVLRGDIAPIRVGSRTNIQDGAILHGASDHPVVVGDGVTIGHAAIVHGCTIGNDTLIGMGAIVLNGARIGDNCIIGAGALVTEGKVIPHGSVAFGSPAHIVRTMTPEDVRSVRQNAREYVRLAKGRG